MGNGLEKCSSLTCTPCKDNQQQIDIKVIQEIDEVQKHELPNISKTLKKVVIGESIMDQNERIRQSRKSNSQIQRIPIQQDEIQQKFKSNQLKSLEIMKPSQALRSPSLLLTPEMFIRKFRESIQEKYEVVQFLGGGSFGSVNLAKSRVDGQLRAIKTIVKNQNFCTQQYKEAEILSKIDHPNVLKLYEIFEDEINIHLVTEYVSGGELFKRIVSQTNFPEEQVKEIMRQILSAVAYCHSKGIVHRDLKPENILFEGSPPCNTIKIIDFGTSALKMRRKEKLKTLYGTRFYVAPEVLSGKYDQKCDI